MSEMGHFQLKLVMKFAQNLEQIFLIKNLEKCQASYEQLKKKDTGYNQKIRFVQMLE